MMNCLAVGLGGFAGAVLRYLIGSLRWIYHILNLCTGIFGADPGWTYGNSPVLCIT